MKSWGEDFEYECVNLLCEWCACFLKTDFLENFLPFFFHFLSMDGITYEPQEGEIEDESEEEENEDELNTEIDMEITFIDKKNDSVECSLIFSENESFSDVSHIVSDIINDREVKLEVQECINGLLDSIEK